MPKDLSILSITMLAMLPALLSPTSACIGFPSIGGLGFPGAKPGSGTGIPGSGLASGGAGAVPGAKDGLGAVPGSAGKLGAVPGPAGGLGAVPGSAGKPGAIPGPADSLGAVPGSAGKLGAVPGPAGGLGAVPGSAGKPGAVPGLADGLGTGTKKSSTDVKKPESGAKEIASLGKGMAALPATPSILGSDKESRKGTGLGAASLNMGSGPEESEESGDDAGSQSRSAEYDVPFHSFGSNQKISKVTAAQPAPRGVVGKPTVKPFGFKPTKFGFGK